MLLRRFWLGSDEAAAVETEDQEGAVLPEIPFRVAYPLQQALNALPDAAVYGLIAAAYSLVYGLSGRINLAFGELAAVGGLGAVVGSGSLRDAPPAAALAAAGAAMFGATVERTVLWRLRRSIGQQRLVATVGVALMLREYLRLSTGSRPLWLEPVLADPARLARAGAFVVAATPMALILAAAAAAASAGLLAVMRFTGFGRDWRAAADDPLAAALMGVDPRWPSLRTAALAAALVGAAGAGVTLNYGGIGLDYTTGLGLKALIAAILGGIGSVPGAFLGGSSAVTGLAGRARRNQISPMREDLPAMAYTTTPRGVAAAGRAGLPAGALDGVRRRRVTAVALDLVLVSILAFGLWLALLVLTFGLSLVILPPLFPFVAFFYNGLSVSGPSMATPGMRLCGLELRTDATGARVSFVAAALHAVLFYFSWTVPPILLASLIARDKRCLHDMLSGVVAVRRL